MQEYLPKRVKKSDIVKSIETRADFNRIISSLKRFSVQGAEEPVKSSRGAKSTKWEVDEFMHKQRIENARRTRERKKLNEEEMKSRGKKLGMKRGEMGTIRENELKPSRKKFTNLSQKEWELAKGYIDNMLDASYREDKQKRMKANYIKGMIEAGFSQGLIDLVEKTPLDKFIKTFNTDTEATFDFIYDPLELIIKENALRGVWGNANNG